jgi:hypothetical protein
MPPIGLNPSYFPSLQFLRERLFHRECSIPLNTTLFLFSPSLKAKNSTRKQISKMAEEQQELTQSQIDKEIEHFKAHLLSVCSALGRVDRRTGIYVPGDEVLDCLKDIKRYLKDEDGQVHFLNLIARNQELCLVVCLNGRLLLITLFHLFFYQNQTQRF